MPWKVRHTAGFRLDLAELAKRDAPAAARIFALLDEISGDPTAVESLTDDHFSDAGRGYDVSWLRRAAHSERLNLWRLKLFGLLAADTWVRQRIIYAVDGQDQTVWIVAVMPRDEEYELDSPRFRRIRNEYHHFGIPLLPRA